MTNLPSQLPPLTWLRAFEESARHLNFTRAAAELNMTQSAVSQHVRSLEAFLGRDLFIRKTRVLELTEDGANYLPGIREAFGLIAASTQAFTGGATGQILNVQCNMAFSVFWLAPRLYRLYARHPGLVLNIVTPIWDPERHATHAALEIRFGRAEEISDTAERLPADNFYPVCAPGYQDGEFDLATATLFDCAGTTGTWDAWFAANGREFGRAGEVNLVSTYVIAITGALNGAGITMAHDTLVRDLLKLGQLVRPFTGMAPLNEGYFLLPPSPHTTTPASEAFLKWIREEVAESH
ncbi:LysR family transcriptional regulator [Ruegeria sp. EL01]|uniref:LysR family transcriptional regulator n=1 Tax=Ruegeria sp. EL01 TaxID=2107578 RepID=UPI000EA80724|nr:LysR family transcriptional regulator [Ruegeria sp. EL01]